MRSLIMLVSLRALRPALLVFALAFTLAAPAFAGTRPVVNAMAPLLVGDPRDPKGSASRAAWDALDVDLRAAKELGIHAISTDVWWGLVEPEDDRFEWAYYDELARHVLAAGLDWVPILSFHQCGGNVGDECDVPLPAWVWTKLAPKTPRGRVEDLRYVSEQGHDSKEYVAAWATPLALSDYEALMRAFQAHFAPLAGRIAEVNVSLGPAGELRYPSYNAHDQGSGYPTRGALQAYSDLALRSFVSFAAKRHGSLAGARKAYGKALDRHAGGKVAPPKDPASFLASGDHVSTLYGRDFFDWYAESLVAHGDAVLRRALAVFAGEGAAFRGVDVGAKIPGIHWRIGHKEGDKVVLSDRLAELAAGLIRTSDAASAWRSDAAGRGYRPIVAAVARLEGRSASRIVLHFTCLEMPDGQDRPEVQSLAQSLVRWVGAEAHRQRVPLKGENALGWNLPNAASWDLMRAALQTGDYEGLTLLRMRDFVDKPVGQAGVRRILEK